MIHKQVEITLGLRTLGTSKTSGVVTIWSNPLKADAEAGAHWKREQTISVVLDEDGSILDMDGTIKQAIQMVYSDLELRRTAESELRVMAARATDERLALEFAKAYTAGLGIGTTLGKTGEDVEAVVARVEKAEGKGRIQIQGDSVTFK